MTEPMKTAEDPRLELAIADAMRENIESTRIMDHVEPLKRVVQEYAAQQVAERERIKESVEKLIAVIEEYCTMDMVKIKHDYPYYEAEYEYIRTLIQKAKDDSL